MSTQRRYKNLECIVLKFINFKDSDKIFTLFAKDIGKISAGAPGVRKISSKRGGNLDSLNHITVGISTSKNGFNTITEVKTINSFRGLKKRLKDSVRGFYIAELVHKLMEEGQENNEVFDLLVTSLERLGAGGIEVARVVNEFEVSLMELLGYAMYLDRCAKCSRKFSEDWEYVKFNPSHGGFICDKCSLSGEKIDKETARVLNSYVKKQVKRYFNKESYKQADVLIKMFVSSILEDKTKTEKVFGEV
jgi:DNA repair protein RecO (recombination protein O)